MSRKKFIVIILTISFLLGIIGTINIVDYDVLNEKNSESFSEQINLEEAGGKVTSETYEIEIDGSSGYHNWEWAVSQSWCRGSGTYEDPYIIENLEIKSPGIKQVGCLSIKNSNVTFIIQNCKFYGATYSTGIKLKSVNNGTIINNECWDNSIGTYVSDSCKNCSIIDNILNNNEYGIKLSGKTNNITLTQNNLFNNSYGIYIDNSFNITAYDNLMNLGGVYVNFDSTSIDQMRSLNIDLSNIINGKNFYYYIDQNQLSTNDFLNGGQVILINCNHSLISNLDVSQATVGVSLFKCNNVSILRNTASQNYHNGIYILDSNNITLKENIANYCNGDGISVQNGDYEQLIKNEVNYNELNGIYLYDCWNCNISMNNARYNLDTGIKLDFCFSNNLTDNTIIKGGIELLGDDISLGSHKIDISNTVNGKPIYYYAYIDNLKPMNFSNAGQIILIMSDNSIVSNTNTSSVSIGIVAQYCSNLTVNNCNSSFNREGFYFRYVYESRIAENIVSNNNFYGINLLDVIKCNISKNEAKNNGDSCFYMINCNYNNITENTADFCINYGFYLYDCNYNNISRNTADMCSNNGFNLQNCNNNTISRNEINYNGIGLSISASCENNTISVNSLKNNREYGIYLNQGKNNNITMNILDNCGLGIREYNKITEMTNNYIDSSNKVNNNPLYFYAHKNNLDSNKFLNAGQVILVNCSDTIILNINASRCSIGFALYHCRNNTISYSNASFNSFYGIYAYRCNSTFITENIVNNNSLYGIYLTSVDPDKNSNISNNIVNYNGDIGIFLYAQYNDTIYNNTLIKNRNYGIYLYGEYNNITSNKMIECGLGLEPTYDLEDMNDNYIDSLNLVNNMPLYYYVNKTGLDLANFSGAGQIILVNCSYTNLSNVNLWCCSIGIALYYSNNNTISNVESLSNYKHGLFLYSSSENNISNNIFSGNKEYGMEIDGDSLENLIYNNYFVDNLYNAIDYGLNNSWNSIEIGNYWDDYTGRDANDDKIGDTPYIISDIAYLAQDNYPIWDDGPEIIIPPASDDDDEEEEPAPIIVPFGNYYLVFVVLAIIAIMIYVKKRKLNY